MTAPQRALVVVDVQQEYFQGPLTIQYPPPDQVLGIIFTAIESAQVADIPVVLIQHEGPAGAVIFGHGSDLQRLHPRLEALRQSVRFTKNKASIFTSPEFTHWLHENAIDTVTLAGFMVNNCLLASAAAETPDITVEILSDASGTINLSNQAGVVSARELHETLMALLHSNWAAVTKTASWTDAVRDSSPLMRSNLIASAVWSI